MLFVEEAKAWTEEHFPKFKFVDADRQLENGLYFIYLTLELSIEALNKLMILSNGQSRLMSTSFKILSNQRVVFKHTCLIELEPLLATLNK